jgi:hypothetical protein
VIVTASRSAGRSTAQTATTSVTWWSNYGQLRRNTDRKNRHRRAAPCLATVVLITGRLLDWRNRWSQN